MAFFASSAACAVVPFLNGKNHKEKPEAGICADTHGRARIS